MRRRPVALLAVAVAVAIAALAIGCGGSPAASGQTGRSTGITVYGAASLKNALAAAKTAYEAANRGTSLTISTGSSAALEAQIEQGAPADLFLSADTANPQKLVEAGLAAGAPVRFASNALAIVVPASNPAGIATPADLAKGGLKIIAAAGSVPITTYARQLVTNLAGEPGYPPDFAAGYEANVASRETDVGAVVAKVAAGEGDAAIVYATDALGNPKLIRIAIPASAGVSTAYAGVVVKASRNAATAVALLAWLAGPTGRSILATFGFGPPA